MASIQCVGTRSQSGWHRSRCLPKFGAFVTKCQITKDLNVPDYSQGQTTVQELGYKVDGFTGNQFVIPLYVNGKLVDGYSDSGADISLVVR